LLASGCSGGGRPAEPTGRIEVAWIDSAGPTRFAVRADAAWCAADSLFEIIATRHDTAFGLILLAADSARGLGPASYAVMPAKTFIPWRPRSIAGLRLVEAVVIKSFESGSGEVRITEGGPDGLSGTLDVRLVSSNGPDSLHVTGSFADLAIVPARLPCRRLDKPAG